MLVLRGDPPKWAKLIDMSRIPKNNFWFLIRRCMIEKDIRTDDVGQTQSYKDNLFYYYENVLETEDIF